MPKLISGSAGNIQKRKRSVKNIRLFVHENVLNDMIKHADEGDMNEIMGLMIGKVYQDDEGKYAIAERIATSGLIADRVSVKFDQDDLS